MDSNDFDHSVVVDCEGTVVAELPNMEILGDARLARTGDHDLLLLHESWDDDSGSEPRQYPPRLRG